jgi:guanylate kinase
VNHEELEDWEMVLYRMGAEGFHYCFRSYSSFEEIKDEKFHELRKTYLSISSQLEEYVKSKVEEGQNQIDDFEDGE